MRLVERGAPLDSLTSIWVSAMESGSSQDQTLRRILSDAVALSALPGMWIGYDRKRLAKSLVDAILNTVSLDFVLVRWPESNGGSEMIEGRVTGHPAWSGQRPEIAEVLEPWSKSLPSNVPQSIANPFGTGQVRIMRMPLGLDHDDGTLIAGTHRPEFPTDQDRLMLMVAVNQASMVLQRQRAAEAVAQSEARLQLALSGSDRRVNIIERKQIEEKLREAQQMAQVGSWRWDLRTDQFHLSDETYRIIGVDPTEHSPAHDAIVTALHPADRERVSTAIDSALLGEGTYDLEFRIVRPDGEARHIYSRAMVVRTEAEDAIEMIGTAQDITDRKQIEERLRRSEALLAEAQALAHVGSWSWDLRTDELTWSDEHYRICGLERQEGSLIRERGLSLIHPDDLPRVRLALNESIRDGTAFALPLRVLRPDGSVRSVQSRGRPAFGPDGKVVRMHGTIQDVTERAQVEEASRVAHEQLELAMRGSNLGIWDLDLPPDGDYRDTPVRFINVWESLGYDPAEFPTTASASRALGHPDDLVKVDAAVAACLAGEIEEIQVENRIRHKDGSYHWLLTLGRCMRAASGKPTRLIGTVLDITDRKRAEAAIRVANERLALATRGSHVGIWEVDMPNGDQPNGRVWSVNFWENLGYGPDESPTDVAGSMALMHPDDRERTNRTIAEYLAGESGAFEVENRSLHKDGSYRWFLTRGVAGRNSNGEIIRLTGTVVDITGQKKAEKAIERARDAAERASRVKDDFLASVSHELRTPLAGMLLWAEMLESRMVEEADVPEALRAIRESAQSQQHLIEDLLDISRILAGEMRLNVRETDLAKVIRAALDIVRPQAKAKRIEITEQLDCAAGPLRVDSARMQQVVLNLLNNAVKFTPENGGVSVRLRGGGDVQEIEVADTGQGISAEFLPHVFERFRQADVGMSRRHGGLGLGLAIARELIELHDGTIRVASPGENQGTTFTIEIPVGVSTQDVDRGPSRPRLSPFDDDTAWRFFPSSLLRGVRVLVVEDDPTTREVIQYLLQQSEAEVTTIEKASDALKTFRQSLKQGQRFDVLLSDVGLPEMNGHELLLRVRALERQTSQPTRIPAVALTAYAREEDRASALAAGFDAHLSKPVAATALVNAIAACVGRKLQA